MRAMLARANFEVRMHATTGEQSSRMLKTFVQQGRRRVETGGVPSGYVEGLNDARTKLADFFSVLLVRHFVVIQPNMVSEFMDHRVAHLLNDFRFGSAEP